MPLSTFLNLLGAGAGTLSAAFFALGTLQLNEKSILEIAGTYWDFNKHLAASISAQRAEYIIGAGLLLLTFILQIAANLTPPEIQPEALRSQTVAISLAAGLFIIGGIIGRLLCHALSSRMQARVWHSSTRKQRNEAF